MSGVTLLFFLLFGAFYVMRIITFVLEVMRLVDMYRFYTYLLKIPDVSTSNASLYQFSDNVFIQVDIQTISWPEIVRRIEAIREENPVTALSSATNGNP